MPRSLFQVFLTCRALLAPMTLLGQTWDSGPLQSPTPIPRDGLPESRTAFFEWLRHGVRSEDQAQKARERIYTYVSEAAKRTGGAFPTPGDTSAVVLFRSAAQLGVAGADQVVTALTRDSTDSHSTIPAGLILSLRPPLFSLGSDDHSWVVCYPYYFMSAPAGRQRPNNGVETEVAVLSTLVAPDSAQAGSSQATIFLAAAAGTDSANHVGLWLRQLDVDAVPTPPGSRSGQWFRSPGADLMRREVVVIGLPKRVVVVAYIGLAGTYEANRPHFLNLLRTLAPGHCAA